MAPVKVPYLYLSGIVVDGRLSFLIKTGGLLA